MAGRILGGAKLRILYTVDRGGALVDHTQTELCARDEEAILKRTMLTSFIFDLSLASKAYF